MYTYIHTLDNAHNSQAQGLNLRRRRSLCGKRIEDINDSQNSHTLVRANIDTDRSSLCVHTYSSGGGADAGRHRA